jgi:hypothetical protein
MRGDDPRLCYVEWSAEVLDEDGNEVAPDRVPDQVASDPKVWRKANPAIPARIAVSHVGWELRALDRRGFAVERLGVADWPADYKVVFIPDYRGSGLGPVAVTSRCGTQSSTWTKPS